MDKSQEERLKVIDERFKLMAEAASKMAKEIENLREALAETLNTLEYSGRNLPLDPKPLVGPTSGRRYAINPDQRAQARSRCIFAPRRGFSQSKARYYHPTNPNLVK